MCFNFRENLDNTFFDKTLFYFLCNNKLIIITFVLQCADKKMKFPLHKRRELDELQLLLFKILIYFKVMNLEEIISFSNRKE